MTLDEAIEDIKAGHHFAAVFQPRDSNEFAVSKARLIIRMLHTNGGKQLALHELDYVGRTSSGAYGEDMVRCLAESTINRWMTARFGAITEGQFHWLTFNELDLPMYLWAGLT